MTPLLLSKKTVKHSKRYGGYQHLSLILINFGNKNRFKHDDVIKWKHFPRYWPFVGGIYRSPMNSPHKGQRRGALMFSLICTRINGRANNDEAGDLRRHRAHYDVIVMNNKLLFVLVPDQSAVFLYWVNVITHCASSKGIFLSDVLTMSTR